MPTMATSGFSLMKKKNFKFDVKLEVEELSSVPFVSSILFAKVRLLNGGSFTNFTNRVEVDGNRVLWQKYFQFACKLQASVATGILEPCMCRISVRKELKGGRSYQKLGYADVNLAQFAGAGRTCRRYVLDGYNSKHRQDNSTLEIVIDMTLLSGDPCFKVPVQHDTKTILITNDGAGGELHMGNKGGTSEDGAGDGTRTGLTNTITARSSQTSLDQDQQRSLKLPDKIRSGHIRHVSDQSKITSGNVNNHPAPLHTRQSSADASLISHHTRIMSGGSSDSAVYMGSMPRVTKRSDTGQVLDGERRLNLTRVDPNELVNELINGIDFNDKTATEGSGGLQLFVAKDGTAVLGSTREPQPPQSLRVLHPQLPSKTL